MTTDKYDCVTWNADGSGVYHVQIATAADDVSELAERAIILVGDALDALSGFLHVEEVRLHFTSFQDGPVDGIDLKGTVRRGDTRTITVENEMGIGKSDLLSAIEDVDTGSGEVPVLSGLDAETGHVDVYLNQGFAEVHVGSDLYKTKKSHEIINDSPEEAPIRLKCNLTERTASRNDAPVLKRHRDPPEAGALVYQLDVEILSEFLIQTGDEPFPALVRINQSRFSQCYDQLADSQDIIDVTFVPVDWYPASEYNQMQLLDYEGTPADDLVEQYRREWVERELRDQAIGREEDGVQVLDFGTVDEEVFTEELQHRIEVFLADESENTLVDRVRVTERDGTTLEGRVDDGTVDWNA